MLRARQRLEELELDAIRKDAERLGFEQDVRYIQDGIRDIRGELLQRGWALPPECRMEGEVRHCIPEGCRWLPDGTPTCRKTERERP